MFIRRTLSKAGKGRKKYYTYRLVESHRIGQKVRQRTLLSLGSDFDLPKEHWADLTQRIEEILEGRESLIGVEEKIEILACNYASSILAHRSEKLPKDASREYVCIDLEGIEKDRSRSVGVETILYETIRRLKLPELFEALGCSNKQSLRLQALLMAKAIDGGSEKAMLEYLEQRSAAGELIGLENEMLSLSSFYRTGDLLHTHKEQITSFLYEEQKAMLNLEGNITLFDLTNTYFEGEAQGVEKARRGRSKEKRSDAMLITLALVVDGNGALKGAELYAGNVAEASTFQEMMQKVYGNRKEKKDTTLFEAGPPIVAMDAGIATEANIRWLKEEGYRYIVVSRKRHRAFDAQESVVVNAEGDADKEVTAYRRITEEGEVELYCRSKAREAKEEAMFTKSEEGFLAALEYLKEGLSLPRRIKKYEKVLEKIGRLKERYAYAAQHYVIEATRDPEGVNAAQIHYHKKEEVKGKDSDYGVYCLRSNLSEMDEKELWHTYITLTEIEAVFRSLKSELGLRPIFHHREERIDAHLFLTLIAYTLVHTIRHQLKKQGIHDSWETIRKNLSTLSRSTLSLPTKEGIIHLRLNDRAEPLQRKYFDALEISYGSDKRKTTISEQM